MRTAEDPTSTAIRSSRSDATKLVRKTALLAIGLLTAGAMLTACSRSSGDAAATKNAASQEPRYALAGEVLSVDATNKTIRVRHNEIKGLMPAMTMDFAASPGDISLVKPGDRIRADLVQAKQGDFHLERVFRDNKVADDTVTAISRQLREDTSNRGKNVYREVGETAPDFALYDQSGNVVQMTKFRGKQIMLDFIYTRCPVANMCPLSTAKMMETQKLARAADITNLELISISLDPTYDTPGVLKEYAAARGIDTTNFSFLTGPETAIKDLLAQFGVISEFEGDIIKHTLTTLLIDENGKIIYRADGSQWEPKEFVAKMRKA